MQARRPRYAHAPEHVMTAIERHEALFTSGAYVQDFRPDVRSNPFEADYARKRDAVIGSVSGKDQKVLDVGGGMGRMSIPLSERHFVTLTDLSPQMLDLARPWASERLDLRQANARSLPFEDQQFDYVLCIDVLPHLQDPMEALLEARRVLRPGGTLLVDVTNAVPFWTLAYPSYVGRRPDRWLSVWRAGGVLPEWRQRVRHHRRAELVDYVKKADLELRTIRTFGPRACPKWLLATATRPLA
jgi:ubiquinone/menaquinone biosynthesis C-methylase UbiE